MGTQENSNQELHVDYRQFFARSFDLMCVFNNTHFLEVNEAWCHSLEYTSAELLAKPIDSFLHPDERGSLHTRVSDSKIVNRFISKYGKTVWLEWTIPNYDEVGEIYYASARDVTENILEEQRTRAALEEVRRKTEELKRSNLDLEQFAYAASHDLQTPLRKVKNFTQHLVAEYGHLLQDDDAKTYTRFIVEGASTAQELVDGLLTYSRTGRTIKYDDVDLSLSLGEALLLLQDDIEEKGVVVNAAQLPTVCADKSLIARVFQNLIGNSIKFRRPGHVPVIAITSKAVGRYWTISVSDNGRGFDQKYSNQIFSIFRRLDTNKAGSGMGLTLCKRIIERHGGQIWAVSEPGVGTTFYFTIPK